MQYYRVEFLKLLNNNSFDIKHFFSQLIHLFNWFIELYNKETTSLEIWNKASFPTYSAHFLNLRGGMMNWNVSHQRSFVFSFILNMVRSRKRITNRGENLHLLPEAARCVLNQAKSVRCIAKEMNLCHVTLSRYCNKLRNMEAPKAGYNPHTRVFSKDQEKALGQ